MFGPFTWVDGLMGLNGIFCLLVLAYANQWVRIPPFVGRGFIIAAAISVLTTNTYIHLREFF